LEARLGQLKAELENEIAAAKAQKIVSALALKYASQAWALAAQARALEDSPWSAEERLESLNQKWADKSASWMAKETAGLRLYFESLAALCLSHAQDDRASWAFADIDSIIKESSRSAPFAAREAEARLYWSNRLTVLAPVMIRLKAREQSQFQGEIQKSLVDKARAIAERRDIHYQGRMELLYFNNAQALARMNFLLAKSPASPLAGEAQSLEAAWEEQIKAANASLADQIALTWLTSAQLSFPLAFWFARTP
jgi:hypothetical protein